MKRSKDDGVAPLSATITDDAVASPPDDIRRVAPADGELPIVDAECFAIHGEHARGGLGRVLSAEDLRLGRPVAIKELLNDTPNAARRFVREARMTARLQHPAIVPVYEAGRWPTGKMFYAMKLVSGRSLKEVLLNTKRLDERLALLPHLIAVAEAIGYAHSRRVVHRDLKPSNVMIGEFGETVVIDWGLAKDLDDQDLTRTSADGPFRTAPDDHTAAGTVLGTPSYMAPEQAEGADVDERADVYAIGALLYHALSGAPPYSGASAAETVRRVLDAPPRPLVEREPGVPRDLAAIVGKAMARSREDRYRDGRTLAEDLRRFQTGQLVGAHHYSTPMLVRRWVGRRRAAVSISVALLAVLAVAMTVSIRRIVRERSLARERAHALTLTQARTSLAVDPTAALAWLKTYPSDAVDQDRAHLVAADAIARGVARHVLVANHSTPSAALSPDGTTVVGGGEADGLTIWKLRSGTKRTLPFRTTTLHIAYSPRGDTLVAAGEYGRLAIWRSEGDKARELVAHHSGILELVFSDYSDSFLTIDEDRQVCWWAVKDPTCRATDLGGTDAHVGFARDGTPLAVVARANDVEVWDLRLKRPIRRLPQNARVEETTAPTRDGRFAVLAGERLRVWNADGLQVADIPVRGRVAGLVLSDDGHRLAELSNDRTVAVHDLDRKTTRVLDLPQRALAVTFSPDGRDLAVSGAGGTITVWDIDADVPQTLLGHTGFVCYLSFSRDGSTLLSAGNDDRSVRVWALHPSTRRVLREQAGMLLHAAFSPNGDRIATASNAGIAHVWDVNSGDSTWTERHHDIVQSVAFSSDGRWLAAASWDRTATWKDLATGAAGTLPHDARVQRVVWLKDGLRLATASMEGAISIFSLPDGKREIIARHVGPVSRLALSPDHQTLLSAADDGVIRLTDLTTRASREIGRHGDGLAGAAFFPDGRTIAAASVDGEVRLWHVADGSSEVLRRPGMRIDAITVSPDGEVVAAGAWDGAIYLWEGPQRTPRVLRLHAGRVRNLAFSPDSQLLASASYDHSAGIWSRATDSVALLRGHDGDVMTVVFSRDGRQLATASADATVRLWNVSSFVFAPRRDDEFRRWLAAMTSLDVGADTSR